MLVLSRRPGERIMVGTDIVITIVEVNGHRARIGIEAPDHIDIRRSEISEREVMVPEEFAVEWASLRDFCDPRKGAVAASCRK